MTILVGASVSRVCFNRRKSAGQKSLTCAAVHHSDNYEIDQAEGAQLHGVIVIENNKIP